METEQRIVVGFDGSPASAAALRWALRDGRAAVVAVEVCPPDTEFLPATSLSLHPRGTVPRRGTGPLARVAEQIAGETGAPTSTSSRCRAAPAAHWPSSRRAPTSS
ncbi:universal stress protein [Actinokineospora soli]|uniref:Universal stress protein n=1 Tax=Actinokineospora soli TaxID=1048753 RepID=A0ABW2TNX8_9PSEU